MIRYKCKEFIKQNLPNDIYLNIEKCINRMSLNFLSKSDLLKLYKNQNEYNFDFSIPKHFKNLIELYKYE